MRDRAAGIGRRLASAVTAAALAVAGAVVVAPAATTTVALADTAPPDPATPETVSADPLPTVQVNGVVWAQVIVGDTVYATGSFTAARPAGSPPGTNETPRANLLAYSLTTGELITSFDHALNGQGRAITASPDGSRIYVGGDFTTVDGQPHARIAAFSTADGSLSDDWTGGAAASVRALTASDTVLYAGGVYASAMGNNRMRLSAYDAATGALLNWAPQAANGQVNAMVLTPDRSLVIVGGQFNQLNGIEARGLGAVDAVTGATVPWAANQIIRNAGNNASISSLRTDGVNVYGAGWSFNQGGNFEGAFAAVPNTGELVWLEDCHGDTYDTFGVGGVLYKVGHAHFCGNVGGFPQTEPWTFYRALAWTTAPAGTVAHNSTGNYFDFFGHPAPAQLNWYPRLAIGSYTGQDQAAWTITGTSDYLVLGGEFPTVNGTGQQGLVRFARRTIAPNQVGPQWDGPGLTPRVVSLAAGTARVAWTTTYDNDNEALTYTVVRDGDTASPVYTTTVTGRFWQTKPIGFVDEGLAPGSSHTYRVQVRDPFDNTIPGPTSQPVTISSTSASGYARAVLDDEPGGYWRLGEPSGATAYDWAGFADLTLASSVTRGAAGALTGDTDAASTFSGATGSIGATPRAVPGPDTFSVEAWFRTTTTRGGKIIGFGTAASGNSTNYDRHVYMTNDGRLVFGVYSGGARTVTTTARYNNGQWHHVVATLSGAGMALHVDGTRVGQNQATTSAQSYDGYWRVGGDNLGSWPTRPTSNYFAGTIDEVAVYPRALDEAEVAAHFAAATGVNTAPTAEFSVGCEELSCSVDASGSADPDGTIATYEWDFGDGATGNGATATHTFPAAGDYRITLTVTDNLGATASATRTVSPRPAANPSASTYAVDAFERTVTTNGWGTADTGGAWANAHGPGPRAVSAGAGVLTLATPGSQTGIYLPGVSATDTAVTVTLTADKPGSGNGTYLYVVGRRVSTNNEYRARLRITNANTVQLALTALIGSGTETTLVGEAPLAGVTFSPGTQIRVRFQVVGTGPTTLRLKAWPAGGDEPAGWARTGTDNTPALQASGAVGLTAFLSGSAATAPVVVQASDFRAMSTAGAPVAAFTASCTGLTCAADASTSTDPAGAITGYTWSWGDGTVTSGPTSSHTFTEAGTYVVTLTVTNSAGWTDVTTRTVTVG
ncbi:MAG: PKD domain-containing protein [Frankia sp.]|nr:PKD domain-containing protein [Frankia sp.]